LAVATREECQPEARAASLRNGKIPAPIPPLLRGGVAAVRSTIGLSSYAPSVALLISAMVLA
jgi:hypothetical protein